MKCGKKPHKHNKWMTEAWETNFNRKKLDHKWPVTEHIPPLRETFGSMV